MPAAWRYVSACIVESPSSDEKFLYAIGGADGYGSPNYDNDSLYNSVSTIQKYAIRTDRWEPVKLTMSTTIGN